MRARQLAPFERQVLLLLVGCHISPPVLRTFINTKTGMDELSSSKVTVCAAEQAWCICKGGCEVCW